MAVSPGLLIADLLGLLGVASDLLIHPDPGGGSRIDGEADADASEP